MLTDRHGSRHRGFSMVELTVVVAIAGVLLAVGLPALGTYMQNSKLRNTAKTLFSSVQLARAEAIRRNLAVDFILTSTAVSATMADSPTANLGGPNWLVRAVIPNADPSQPPSYELVEGKSWQDGSGQSSGSSSTVSITATAATVQFNGVGGLTGGTPVTFEIKSNPDTACAKSDGSGTLRCSRIVVMAGGQVRLCDPAIPASGASNDPRVCP